jgi:hypothetical protein
MGFIKSFIKRAKMDLNVEYNEVDGESSQIPKESHKVENENAMVVQGCSNYETLPDEQTLMHILDHEANLDGQGSMKARNYRAEWKFKYLWVRAIDVLGQTRLKCIFCEKFRTSGPLGVEIGSVNLQNSGLLKHNLSNQHIYARTRWLGSQEKIARSMETHIQKALESNKVKIISSMKMIYFLSLNNMSLSSFPDLIKFRRYMEMPSISAVNDYGTYENAISDREFLLAIASVLEDKLIEEVNTSPFFFIMVDESTDKTLKSHLISYVTYLEGDGIGQLKIQFLNLQGLPNRTSISIFEAWKKTSNKYDLVQSHLVGLTTDGVASMVGVHEGFATKFKRKVLHLFRIHCIAHREALALKDAVETITPLTSLEKLSNRLHGWIGKFFLRNEVVVSFCYHLNNLKHQGTNSQGRLN